MTQVLLRPDPPRRKDPSLVVDEQTKMEMKVDPRKDDGLPRRQFEKWMYDLRLEPAWRQRADLCADYYDGNQLTQEQLQKMEDNGMAPIVANIIRPTIDVVLGMEAKSRQNWRVEADGADWQDVAEGLSAKLHEAERESMADRATSDAYAGQIKAGMGWVEVGRNMDPFAYPYKCRYIHRREIWWDWRAKEPDLSDARFLVRRRWVDLDELIAIFPDKRGIIEQAGNGRFMSAWRDFDLMSEAEAQMLVNAQETELRTSLQDLDWRDTLRARLCLSEFWYRTWHRGFIIKIGNNIVPVDTNNPHIAAAIATGKVEIKPAVYSKLRLSWWVGPHRLADIQTKRRNFPYVPLWGFREDRTGAPYGLVRPMIDPQDEYNARRSKLMWLLSAKMLKIDSDALDKRYNDIEDAAEEASRPDATFVMDPNRKPGSDIKVETDHNLATQQFEVMNDAMELLQKTGGVYKPMEGQTSSAHSGYAINSLVEQGTTTLAEINDNYRHARRLVGQQLLDLIVEDIGGNPYPVKVGDGSTERTIILNQPGPNGQILNDVLRAKFKVTLEDVPSTPSYRAQQMMMLTELTKSLPEQIQAFVIPFVMEASDLADRKQIAQAIRQGMGIKDTSTMTPEQQQKVQQQAEEQQALQQQAQELALRKESADVDKTEADAAHKRAQAQKAMVDSQTDASLNTVQQHLNELTNIVSELAKRVVT